MQDCSVEPFFFATLCCCLCHANVVVLALAYPSLFSVAWTAACDALPACKLCISQMKRCTESHMITYMACQRLADK